MVQTQVPAHAPSRGAVAGSKEFIALIAMSMALAALGIDLMLPAFAAIRADLGLAPESTAVAGLVTTYLLGLAAGQLVYGPVADRYGRKPALYAGYGLYAAGALAAAVSPSLTLLLIARFVWGLGAAGPRVITLAIVRDTFSGDRMSRAMSLIMAVFILVPIIAPSLGAAIAAAVSWRWLFGVCVAAAALVAVWARRLPETLRDEHRRPLGLGHVLRAARLVVSHRQTVAYTLGMTALYGVFSSYLGSSEIIFGETFGQADAFPFLFGGLAAVMGAAMLTNARIVGRWGTRRFAHGVLLGYVSAACVLVTIALTTGGRPPLLLFLAGLAVMLSSHALLIPNFNTIAMSPMAQVAGTAASVIGAVQVAGGAALGIVLDRAFDGTIVPISLGFLGYGVVALALVLWAEGGRLFRPLLAPGPDDPLVPVAEP